MNKIDQTAALWAARLDGPGGEQCSNPELDAWLAQDPRHLGAYLRMRAIVLRADKAATGKSARLALEGQGRVVRFRQQVRPYAGWIGAIAASLLLAFAAGGVWQANRFDADYATALGEVKTAHLPDGSAVTLNSRTELSVHYTLVQRDIHLDHGEALFDVAKNKSRPFVVASGQNRVRAVGTSFGVSAVKGHPFSVLVREGVVSIAADRSEPVLVAAGNQAQAAQGQFVVRPASAEQIENALAWRQGLLIFRRQTLGHAAAEFARYSTLRIVIPDAEVARKTVTGTYTMTDPAGFAHAVAIALHLKAEHRGGAVRLTQPAD